MATALGPLTNRQPGRVARRRAARRRGRIGVGVSRLADPERTLGETADPSMASGATALGALTNRQPGRVARWRAVGDAGVSA